jgi:hypothetical protein
VSAPPPVPPEAAQFDFLLGQWELVVRPQASGLAARLHGVGNMAGTWKAWRAFDGRGIEDELRIVDRSGNPRTLSHSLRIYDALAGRWIIAALDVYRASLSEGMAQLLDDEMVISGGGTDAEGRAFVSRTRFTEIRSDSFRWRQERSYDGGRTWSEPVLRIEARRVAATLPR